MDDPEKRVANLRDLARRARRLASMVGNGDRDLLQRYAQDLDEQAATLEARHAAPPTVIHQQQQSQQQQSVDEAKSPDSKPKG